jgi:hypothetical protein
MEICGTYSGYVTHIKNKEKACSECKLASNAYRRNKRREDNAALGYDPRRFKRHNITKEYYDTLLDKHNKKCWICKSSDAVHIDHDHSCCSGVWSCGQCVRGLLCSNCNTAIGLFKDNKELLIEAVEYLNMER